MVVKLLILATASAFLAMADGTDIEPKMRDPHLPPITTLTIQRSGATSQTSGEPAKQCADFKLNSHEIRGYIAKAYEVAEHDYLHMLDWSPCYTSGKVTFKNGVTGIWSIQQFRAGSLKLSNGRTLYPYCPQCQGVAFPAADK